jgi:YHS domain-containing protein
MNFFSKSAIPVNSFFKKSLGGNTYFHKNQHKKHNHKKQHDMIEQDHQEKTKISPLERQHHH